MLTIRVATIADASLIGRLIQELAEYDKELDQARTTEADIARDGFVPEPSIPHVDWGMVRRACGFCSVLQLLLNMARRRTLS